MKAKRLDQWQNWKQRKWKLHIRELLVFGSLQNWIRLQSKLVTKELKETAHMLGNNS